MRLRRFLRLLLLSALGLSMLLAYSWLPFLSSSPTASAHAFVIGSDPVDGSTINKVPTVMRIFFNEDISPTSIAHIYFGPNAQLMDGGHSTVSSTNPRELDTPLVTPGQLPQGSYTDLQGVLAVAWDWLVMAALMLWLGILVVEGLILGSAQVENDLPLPQMRKQSQPLQWLCLAALLFGEIINLILRAALFNQVLGNGGVELGILGQILVETNYGHLWLARIALIGLALGFLWWTTREQHQMVSTNLNSSCLHLPFRVMPRSWPSHISAPLSWIGSTWRHRASGWEEPLTWRSCCFHIYLEASRITMVSRW